MLDICGTSYEDVNITYTKGNKDQMEALLEVQNIRTVFSAELLSIAGTIISDIFPNGLRKSSQIARKKFAAAYKNTTGRDFQDNIDLDALALQVGLEYEDKICRGSSKLPRNRGNCCGKSLFQLDIWL